MKERVKLLLSAIVLIFFCLIAGGSITAENFDGIYVWIGLIVAAFIVAFVINIKQHNKRHELIDMIKSDGNFKFTFEMTIADGEYWVGIDDKSEQIKIVNLKSSGEEKSVDLKKFSNIITVELLEDGRTIYSKSSMRTIGGAAIGGVLAGSAGSIIGGLSGDTMEHNKISRMAVKLLLRDYGKSSITILFSESEIEKGGFIYNVIHDHAMTLIDKIKVIIDMKDRDYARTSMISNRPTDPSQEIERLHDLKVKGIISDEEFQELKEKYINDSK